MGTRTLRTVATAAALTVGISATAKARTYIYDGGWAHLAYKPRNWAAGGVGASARAERLRWTWSATRAVAHGTTVNNNCDPSCAEGTTLRYPGTIVLSRPATCHAANGTTHRFFTRVKYSIDLPRNNGFGRPAGRTSTTFTWSARDLNGYGCHL